MDPADARMPGVSIAVEGAAIQGQRTAESEANGSFSSEFVRPTMNVLAEPTAVLPREILDEILRQHGLQVQSGSGGRLLVVRR